MTDPMQEIRASFFLECEELLEAMQDGLQLLEEGGSDPETINVVFRAVHSIKGGAGAFGFDELVAFAHSFETALDGVRSGSVAVTEDVPKLFFQCGDMLADHVRAARDGAPLAHESHEAVLETLFGLTGETNQADDALADFQPMSVPLDLPDLGGDAALPDLGDFGSPAPAPTWVIRFAPRTELFETGNEPLYLFRALRDMGELSVEAHLRDVPALDELDPARAYLFWTARLVTDEPESAIREVFDFVEDICDLEILEVSTGPAAEPPNLTSSAEEQPRPSSAASEPPQERLAPIQPSGAANGTADRASPAPTAAAPAPAPEPPAAAAETRVAVAPRPTVRVELDRIDRLVNLVGELVINQAMLAQSVAEAGIPTNSPVTAGLDEFLQLTRDIQEGVMMIRAQPVKSLFQRMGRIVREASAAVGKEVRLRTEGDATEIDKTVIELLAEPLMHMIRNSVDHGIETPESRMAAGKPAEGTVHLSASHRSGRVVIEVADDGAGIDRERVRAKAVEKGILAEDTPLSDGEIDMLIFAPGFSTAAEVSNLSGRGVGMDVVKTAIASLGGRITIDNTPGSGTRFSISLPLTLAVLDGMVVKVETETLVVPLTAIVETLMLTQEDVRTLGQQTQVVRVRDAFVPLLDLGVELGYREPLADYVGTIALLITQEDGSRTALVVDAIEDQRQVVIKGLHESYGQIRGVAAATILGDGQIALILDAADLVAHASGRSRRLHQPTALAG